MMISKFKKPKSLKKRRVKTTLRSIKSAIKTDPVVVNSTENPIEKPTKNPEKVILDNFYGILPKDMYNRVKEGEVNLRKEPILYSVFRPYRRDWGNAYKAKYEFESSSDRFFYNFEKVYILNCYKSALESKDPKKMDLFMTHFCHAFVIAKRRGFRNFKIKLIKDICSEIVPDLNECNFEKMSKLAHYLRSDASISFDGLETSIGIFGENITDNINPEVLKAWNEGSNQAAFLPPYIHKESSEGLVKGEILKIKREQEQKQKQEQEQEQEQDRGTLDVKGILKAVENLKKDNMNKLSDAGKVIDAFDIISKYSSDIGFSEEKINEIKEKVLLNMGQRVNPKEEEEKVKVAPRKTKLSDKVNEEIDCKNFNTLLKVYEKESEIFDSKIKAAEKFNSDMDKIIEKIAEKEPLSKPIRRDGELVKDATAYADMNIKFIESQVKDMGINPEVKNKILKTLRENTGEKYDNPPVSRGGVSVKDLNKKKKNINAEDTANAIKGISEFFDSLDKRSNEGKNEEKSCDCTQCSNPSFDGRCSCIDKENIVTSAPETGTSTRNGVVIKRWSSDPAWVDNFNPEKEDAKKEDGKDVKDVEIEKVTEQDLASAYAKLLIARRSFQDTKKQLNDKYKSLGIEELTNELE